MHTAGAGADEAAAWAPAALPLPGGAAALLVFACATESSGVPPDWAATERYSGVALLPDLSDASARRLAAEVASERRSGEPVVVSIHWGANWGETIPAAHRAFAHRLIELGAADVVHGHSSHHPLAAEVYRGRLVLYGCGDLINDYEGITPHGDLRSDVGCLYFATLEAQGGALQRLEIVPLQIRRLRLEAADAQARLVGRDGCSTGAGAPWARRSRPCPAAAAGRCNGSSGRPRHLEFERAQSLRPRRAA